MFSKVLPGSAVSVLGLVFALSVCLGLSGNIALAENPPGFPDLPDLDLCGNNDEFTTEFRLDDCEFKDQGKNPFFILEPGYQVVLESEDEKSVETVLHDTKWIHLDGRRIKTRVLEERAFEWEEGEGGEEGEWKTIEISLNYFAICKRTNAVYYFGEFSRDCEDGFDEDDECEDESNAGSWEAGIDDARPGLMMPGTPLLGAKYFQEIAPDWYPDDPDEPDHAVDRGQIEEMGLNWPGDDEDIDTDLEYEDCIKIIDTNPALGECIVDEEEGEPDTKIYCPGIGLVQDQDLVLVDYRYIDDDDEDDGDDDDDDDDDDKNWRRRHNRSRHHWH
jgi:hypothetical protein